MGPSISVCRTSQIKLDRFSTFFIDLSSITRRSRWRRTSQAFTDYVAKPDYPPIGFYRAYPGVAVQDLKALLADAKVGATSS